MSRAAFLVLLIASPLAGVATETDHQRSVAAVEKVIQMLGDMAAKCKEEKNLEQVAFAEFDQWCKMEIPQTKKAIKKSEEAIESLTAEIAKLTTEAKVLGEEIAKLTNAVANFDSEKKAAEVQRAKDHAAYLEESTDYGESVSALERALAVMQKVNHDVPGTADDAVLLQLASSEKLPAEAKAMLGAFIGVMGKDFMKDMADGDGMDYQAPEANAYDFQGDGIIAMLKRLRDEFRAKLADCQKEEMNSKHSYDMVIQDLVDSVENAEERIAEAKETKARKEERAAAAKGELAETEEVKKADEKTLTDMEVECKEKHLSFTEKQQLRKEEIEAIDQAIKILKDPEALGNAEKYLPEFMQTSKATALSQLRGQDSLEERGVRGKVFSFLSSEATRLHSNTLSLLAQKLMADPFAKVKKMIDDMITRLLEEANADANHEGYCDEEMGKSKITRNKLSEEIDALTAAVEDGKATIMQLTEEIATLTKEVADLDASMVEATELRKKEKHTNEETIEDSKAAQAAVAAATAILKDFYEKASMATGLLQVGVARPKMGSDEWKALANPNYEGPVDQGIKMSGAGASWGHTEGQQTFGEKYTGQQDSAGGVLAMLEVIMSDFANLEADTKAAEAKAQESYEDFMAESKKNKSVKLKKIEMDETDKSDAQVKLQEDTKDLKGTQDELLAADRYYEKLVPQCIDKGMTWEERVAARESEIASLKEALKILSSQGSVGF
jgi:uncharacterized coiled-coil DUF342 family protein